MIGTFAAWIFLLGGLGLLLKELRPIFGNVVGVVSDSESTKIRLGLHDLLLLLIFGKVVWNRDLNEPICDLNFFFWSRPRGSIYDGGFVVK